MSFEAAPDYRANDARIKELTGGLAPDKRIGIPVPEQRLLIEEAQAGDEVAKQILVQQRLRWIHNKFLPGLKPSERIGHQPEDIM